MPIEQIVPWFISFMSVAVAVYFGTNTKRRADKADLRADSSTLATFMVKLESISDDLKEIKADNKLMQHELQEFRERVAVNESSIRSCHKRLDAMEQHLGISLKPQSQN